MSALLMNITLPTTVFVSMLRPFDIGFLRDAGIILVLTVALICLYVFVGGLAAPLFQVPEGRRGMWILCCAFCNNGFMGLPVVFSIFGDEGVALAVMLNISSTILVNILGVRLVMLDNQEKSGSSAISWRKILVNPVCCAVFIGFIFYVLQIPVPKAIYTPIQHLSNATTPLSMVVTGMSLAESRIREVVSDRDAVTGSFMRLVVLPILTWGILVVLPISNQLVVGVMLVIMAMPCAAIAVVLGEEYHGCTQLGARAVFLSSLTCMATIPLITLLL